MHVTSQVETADTLYAEPSNVALVQEVTSLKALVNDLQAIRLSETRKLRIAKDMEIAALREHVAELSRERYHRNSLKDNSLGSA